MNHVDHVCHVPWLQTIGDDLVESIISDNIPILTEEAKFNEAVTSSISRIEVPN